MARILVLANNDVGLYKFRKELLQELLKQNNEVFISLPDGEYIPQLKKIGCTYINTSIDRRGTNPITDVKLIYFYTKIIKKINPDVVLTYTIKPNIYGGIACKMLHIPYIANVTGLGTSIENKGSMQFVALRLYAVGLQKAFCVFFQNEPNLNFFKDKNIVNDNTRLIPGSGVNLEQHCFEEYLENDDEIKFLFIGRIMKDKGVGELLDAAIQIKPKYPNSQFHFIGDSEEDYYIDRLLKLEVQGIIKYHGRQSDVHSYIAKSHAIILPSYHEGTANVLLEAAASGRPVLASKVTGCRETFDEGLSGLGFEAKNVESLVDTIKQFIELPYEKKKMMGIAGRKKMESDFDRQIVVNSYMDEINKLVYQQMERINGGGMFACHYMKKLSTNKKKYL